MKTKKILPDEIKVFFDKWTVDYQTANEHDKYNMVMKLTSEFISGLIAGINAKKVLDPPDR